MDGTIIVQGSFVSTGLSRYIPLRSDVDWMRVVDYTTAATSVADEAYEWYWQRGMGTTCIRSYHHTGGSLAAFTGQGPAGLFTYYNSSITTAGANVATTGSSNVAAPVILTADTTGFIANQTVVRLSNILAAPTICGIDFTVTAFNPGVSFTLPTLANGVAVGGAGFYRVVPFQPYFQPATCIVCNITQAVNPTVTTNIAHNYQPGQAIRFVIPPTNGMTQLSELSYTANVLTTPTFNTFTMDIDTTGFTAFVWPLIAVSPNSYAQVIPVGETGYITYANNLSDATTDTSAIGMLLLGGVTPAFGPAGKANDVIYWVAGKSFSNS
jgi:hypothetical protein